MSLLTIVFSSAYTIICTSAPPVGLNLTATPRVISAASTNILIQKDRINQVTQTSVVATDYRINPTFNTDDPTYASINSNIPIDNTGLAPFNVAGWTILLMYTPFGIFTQELQYSTNVNSMQTNLMGFVSGSLASNLQFSVSNLASGKSITQWGYKPGNPSDLATNANVWTAPVSMAVVGQPQTALIAPNAAIGVQHYHYPIGQQLMFMDTNGVIYGEKIIGLSNGPNDFLVYILNNNLPAAAVPAYVLPLGANGWTNHISSILGLLSIWAHNNTAHVDMSYAANYPSPLYSGGNGLQLLNARTNIFGNEQGATGGDSSSPAFFILGTTNILAFATTSPGDSIGDFIADPIYWNFLTNTVPISTMNVLDLSGYPSY